MIQRMRVHGKMLRAPLMALYLFLGVAAAWHAPHDLGVSHEKAIHASAGAVADPVDTDGFCALCSWLALHQQTESASQIVVASAPLTASPQPLAIDAPASGFLQAHLARGPPLV
jgi:hypothetical protein